MGNTFYFDWEISLISFLQDLLGKNGVRLFSFFSFFGEEIFLVFLIGLFYWGIDRHKGRVLAMSVLFAGVFNSMIKNIFLRNRPYLVSDEIDLLKPVDPNADPTDIAAQGYSFPSGHSANVTAAFTALFLLFRKRGLLVIGVILSLLTGISRFVLGAHFPSDVLAGWACGILTVLLTHYLQKSFERKRLYLILTLICLPGLFYCRSSDYFSEYGILLGFFAGDLYAERFNGFSYTDNHFYQIIRTLGGALIIVGVNALLKVPFDREFLESAALLPFLFRTFRYFLGTFLAIGIYPYLFSVFGKKTTDQRSRRG